MNVLLQLAMLFAGLSMLAVGGGAGIIPDIRHGAVDHYHWMTAAEFLDMFAISRAAPGPGSLIAVLIGLKAAGWAGAAVSFVAMFAPSSIAVHLVAQSWHKAARAPWRAMVERALAPVAVGLTFAAGLSLMRGAESGWAARAITLCATALFAFTEINPIVLLAFGAGTVLITGG